MTDASLQKPLLRGWSHALAAAFALVGAAVLLTPTRHDPLKFASLAIYSVALFLLFATSATYHIPHWSPRMRKWLRRADHSTIFLFIAASYTPLALIVLTGWMRTFILAAIWACALVGIFGAGPLLRAHHRLLALFYVFMGWIALIALAPLSAALGIGAALLLALGGIEYSVGAFMYAFKRPKLWPSVFGYHEAFHALVIVGSFTLYALLLIYVVPFPHH
jgi:hemolysin III